tara:strand:+ start:85 stop:633 length:549 start_codon:yes stop_codon:yes gene_type:complete
MKLITNILYHTIIFFTSICIVDRVAAYFLKVIVNIDGVFQMISYETQLPSFINEIINIPLVIGLFLIFIFYFIYMLNISSKPIDYFKDSKWNRLIICSIIIFVLMVINYAQAAYLNELINIMLAAYLLPIIWFFLFHRFNLKYLEKVEAKYSKFPFYVGVMFVVLFFTAIHPFIIRRISSLF